MWLVFEILEIFICVIISLIPSNGKAHQTNWRHGVGELCYYVLNMALEWELYGLFGTYNGGFYQCNCEDGAWDGNNDI